MGKGDRDHVEEECQPALNGQGSRQSEEAREFVVRDRIPVLLPTAGRIPARTGRQ